MTIPISVGSGAASVAAEEVGGLQYQKIEVLGQGGASILAVNPDGSLNASIIGTPNINVSGSVFATFSGSGSVIAVLKSSSIIGVVTGSVVAIPTGNQSVSGTVGASIIGHAPVVIVGGSVAATVTPPENQSVSGTVGASIIGWVPVQPSNTSTIAYVQNSVAAVIIGGSILTSATANQSVSGTVGASIIGWVPIQPSNTSIITRWADSSVIARVTGSVVTQMQGSVLAYGAPLASLVQGIADLRVVLGGSVIALPAPGAGIRYYVKHVQVANFGSSSVLVKIADNTTSILGWTIAPAGGGSNYDCDYRAAAGSPVTASINGVASVLVSMQGYTA